MKTIIKTLIKNLKKKPILYTIRHESERTQRTNKKTRTYS